jgi:tetratricopeptide (TPR) repeat protein
VLFAITFAGLGVGSGQGGLDQLFNGVFNRGSSGPSVSNAVKATLEHPKQAQAWRDLAIAYESKARVNDAIYAWQRYTALRPKNPDGFDRLGQMHLQKANEAFNRAGEHQQRLLALQSDTYRPFAPSGKLAVGTDPIQQQIQAAASQEQSALQAAAVETNTAYKQAIATFGTVAKLRPQDVDAQFNIARSALTAFQQLGDRSFLPPAIKAYRKIAKLDPTQAGEARARIKQLRQLQKSAPG